jgi:hypothetical protein
VDLGKGVFFVVNPVFLHRSSDTFTMWDDCMSFPDLLVRVRRHDSISLRYQDQHGASHQMLRLDRPTAELLQHEIDHLDGILAIDRALRGTADEEQQAESRQQQESEAHLESAAEAAALAALTDLELSPHPSTAETPAVLRKERYARHKAHWDAQVDYYIGKQ